jgi:hypothetical protein
MWSSPATAAAGLADYFKGVTNAKQEIDGYKFRSEQEGFSA